MKLTIDMGGHSEFRVRHANREDLYVNSALTGVQAVEKVAEWLAVVPAKESAPELAVVADDTAKGLLAGVDLSRSALGAANQEAVAVRRVPKTLAPKDGAA